MPTNKAYKQMSKIIENRYDFIVLFDVNDGNPNGGPDANDAPRIDPQTGEGLVTDVYLKRKVCNYVQMVKENCKPFDMYIKERAILNQQIEWMRANYWDIRTFGALMTNGKNTRQVRGPVQMTFARSVEPILVLSACHEQVSKSCIPEHKQTIPYVLFAGYGYISAHLAAESGFTEEDLVLFWSGLIHMFEDDHSSLRGRMSLRKLIVFKHQSQYGNAPSGLLFGLLTIKKVHPYIPGREYKDYIINIQRDAVPEGVELIEII